MAVFCAQLSFGQGIVDLTSESETTKWLPDGSLSQNFENLGTPSVSVTANIQRATARFNNNTPRSDSRDLWFSMNLGSRTEVVTISFTFSGSAFGLIGFDIHAASTNSVIVRPHRTPDNGLYFVTYQGRVTQNLCKNR